MSKPVLIPRELDFQNERIQLAKKQLDRLQKGTQMISDVISDRNFDMMPQYSKTFLEIAENVQGMLEDMLFYNEYLATGKSIIIRRNGRPGAMDVTDEKIEVDVFTLKAYEVMSNLFGRDAIEIIEVE